jgi:peptide/nickel transport system permease protein
VQGLARGDFGVSLTTGQPVLQELLARLPASLELVLLALVLACAWRSRWACWRPRRPGQLDRPVVPRGDDRRACRCPPSSPGCCWPGSSTSCWGWAPAPLGRLDRDVYRRRPAVTGFYLLDAALAGDAALWWASFKQLILPTLTMAIFVLAPIARMTRGSMLQVLSSDFRAHGTRQRACRPPRCACATRCATRCCRW